MAEVTTVAEAASAIKAAQEYLATQEIYFPFLMPMIAAGEDDLRFRVEACTSKVAAVQAEVALRVWHNYSDEQMAELWDLRTQNA